MGRPAARSRFSTTASVATANRYPASCSRQHRSTSSPGRQLFVEAVHRLEDFPADGQVGAQAEGEESQLPCGGGNRERTRVSVQSAEVEHARDQVGVGQGRPHGGDPARSHDVVGITEGQQPAAGRPDPDVPCRRCSSTGRGVHQVDARIALGPPLHARAGPVFGAVVGHHDFPVGRCLLGGEGLELVLEPRHSVADRHHHADQRRIARTLLFRHSDVLHDRC